MFFAAIRSPAGVPRHLLNLAAGGRFVPVISGLVIDELIRNLNRKHPVGVPLVTQLLQAIPFEIVEVPAEQEIIRWKDLGFGSDSPIVAAALLNEVDNLCTGDRGIHAKAPICLDAGLALVTPRQLLDELTRNDLSAL